MLSEICASLKNYFLRDYYSPDKYIHYECFVIADGQIQDLPYLKPGQYYRIKGSTFNDGVHMYGDADLADEEFEGAIWEMTVPPDFVALVDEISAWCEKYEAALSTPYASESFVAYSRSYKTSTSASGGAFGWEDQFAGRLKKYRRMSEL